MAEDDENIDYKEINELLGGKAKSWIDRHYITILEILLVVFIVFSVILAAKAKTIENECNEFYQNQINLEPVSAGLIFGVNNSHDYQNQAEKYKYTTSDS